LRSPPISDLADKLTDSLPYDGYPVSRDAAFKACEQRCGKLSKAIQDATIALASARGQIVRQHGGTAIARLK